MPEVANTRKDQSAFVKILQKMWEMSSFKFGHLSDGQEEGYCYFDSFLELPLQR